MVIDGFSKKPGLMDVCGSEDIWFFRRPWRTNYGSFSGNVVVIIQLHRLRAHISHISCSFSPTIVLPYFCQLRYLNHSQGNHLSHPTPLHTHPLTNIVMKLSLTLLGLVALASTAHADLLQTRNLRTRAKEPTKKKLDNLVQEDMDFWGRELGGSARRKLNAITKNDKAMKNEDNQFWARELGGSARK